MEDPGITPTEAGMPILANFNQLYSAGARSKVRPLVTPIVLWSSNAKLSGQYSGALRLNKLDICLLI